MKRYYLREESKETLRNLSRQQKISNSCFLDIDSCSNKKQMIDSFSKIYSLTLTDLKNIEYYMTNKMQGFESEESRYTNPKGKFYNLDKYDRLVMRELLRKNGVLVKSIEEDKDMYRTFRFFENSCNFLVQQGYLLKFQFTDYEIIYLLNPDLLESARK